MWKDAVYVRLVKEFGLIHSPDSLLDGYVRGSASRVVPQARPRTSDARHDGPLARGPSPIYGEGPQPKLPALLSEGHGSGTTPCMTWLNEPPSWNEEGGVLTVRTGDRTDFWRHTHEAPR